tara:strand:- start:1669 stop:2298 length:630 start_codon:yes stop_codon:yes gene_type:complete
MSTQIPVNPDLTFFNPDDRLLVATRAWLMFLQGLFKSRPEGHYKWDKNINETEIIITDREPNDFEAKSTRPIISTSRGPAVWSSTSLNQKMQQSFNSEKTVFSDIIGCSMTISVIAREGLEAQNLAYTIFRMIPVFKPSILRLGRMHAIGNNISLTQETSRNQIVPGSSTPEWKMVQLIVPFFIQDVFSSEEKEFYTLMRTVNLHMGIK